MIPQELPPALLAAGLTPLPAVPKDKRPAVSSWKRFQSVRPTPDEISAMFSPGASGMCLVCGAVSGFLECLDFDSKGAAFPEFGARVPPQLGRRLVVERSPSGGYHVFYRCPAGIEGNQKLARDENGKVLIETRGEGGIVLVAPTPGYELVQGDFLHVPEISAKEREALLDASRKSDRGASCAPAVQTAGPCAPAVQMAGSFPAGFESSPSQDFDARGDIRPILEAHGWKRVHGGENEGWQRPGKSGTQQSATFNGTVFFVFSSNAAPFEAEKGYGKFHVYALLEHAGDFAAASRALLAQGYGSDPESKVDLASFACTDEAQGESSAAPDPAGSSPASAVVEVADIDDETEDEDAPVPDGPRAAFHFAHAPGFLDELTAWTLRSSMYSNRAIAFAGALAALSFFAGRRFCTATGLSATLYLVVLAPSGTGKESARETNRKLLCAVGNAGNLGDEFRSGEGLEDFAYEAKSILFQASEISFLFENLKEADAQSRSIASKLLRLYSGSSSSYTMRATAARRPGRGDAGKKAAPRVIMFPNPVVFGDAQPDRFYAALNRDMLENGLIGRTLVLDCTSSRVRNPAPTPAEAFPAVVLDTIADLSRVGEEIGVDGPPRQVAETDAARAIFDAFAGNCDAKVNAALSHGGAGADTPLWSRALEKAYKLALLHAISRSPESPTVDTEDAQWGVDFMSAIVAEMRYEIDSGLGESDFELRCRRVLRYLARCPDKMVMRSRLLVHTRFKTKELDEVVSFLVESGKIAVGREKQAGAGRPRIAYRLVSSPRK